MPPAAAGEAGVAHLLRLFAEDMKVTMTLTGATSPSAISLDCLDRLEQDQHRTHAVPVSYPPDAARDWHGHVPRPRSGKVELPLKVQLCLLYRVLRADAEPDRVHGRQEDKGHDGSPSVPPISV